MSERPVVPPAAPPADLDEVRRRLAAARDPRRALEEMIDAAPVRALLEREFPSQRERFADPLGRRDFLRTMGASLAVAGLGACTRQPDEHIYPYAASPEALVPGKPLFYATSMPRAGGALGLLVESHMGRPTKVEGNPQHPSSLGAADAFAQAAVLGLYDPDRSQSVLNNGQIASWEALAAALAERIEGHAAGEGEGLAILTEPVLSPTLGALLDRALERLPRARWHAWAPVNRDQEREGMERALGTDAVLVPALDRAAVVLSLDSDVLAAGPGHVRHARDFARARRGRVGVGALNRLYALETSPTVTGAMADHRLGVSSVELERLARAVAARLGVSVDAPSLAPARARFVDALARDLRAHAGRAVVVAGAWQPPAVHALALAMNAALDGLGRTARLLPAPERTPAPVGESLRELVQAMRAGEVATLLVLEGNPVHTAPSDLRFAEAFERVPWRLHLALQEDETSRLSHWHVPAAHFLESWGDARAHDGTVGLVQPLIAPLYGGRTPSELLAFVAGSPGASAHELTRSYWAERWGLDPEGVASEAFEARWRTALHEGVVPDTASAALDARPGAVDLGPAPERRAGLELALRPDASAWDGRYANNAWLQETPRPLTRLVWDNALLVGPATAARLRLGSGDVVRVEAGGRAVAAPVWVTPGHPEDVVTAHLGYGRSRPGRVALGVGFDAYALRTLEASWHAPVELEPTGGTRELVSVQDHGRMEGRDIVRVATFDRFARAAGGDDAHGEGGDAGLVEGHGAHDPAALSLYPEYEYEGNSWGMVIDLNACIGCNACMVACQSENNVPVVGKGQVAVGREMHWIRIDRYYEGPDEDPQVLHQPLPCMHCDKAPCEVVCPVGATVHGDEGLNEMIYNRCVGTRYCSNNCPYKVRRFNFFRYADYETEVLKLMRNPDVTVRHRGVMEKCTYCVQRINSARIDAKKAGRPIADGEVVPACAQTCPTEAITFGNLNDGSSAVSALRREPHHYGLLAELGTQPRTTYLSKLRNPNPELAEG